MKEEAIRLEQAKVKELEAALYFFWPVKSHAPPRLNEVRADMLMISGG